MAAQKIYGYLRVSTGKQELDNNKSAILLKANSLGLSANVEWIEEQVSGTKHWNTRKLGDVMNVIQAGDVIITSEVSRFGRKHLDVMSFLAKCSEKKVKVYCTNSDFVIDETLQSQVIVFAQSISAQIEREMISSRTKTALRKKKSEGVVLGRKKDIMVLEKDEKNKTEIKKLIESEVKLNAICTKFNVTAPTLRKFIKKHNLKNQNVV